MSASELKMDSVNPKFYQDFVVEKLMSDPVAAEFLWSIFCSALNGYRCDTVLRPFPSMYLHAKSGEKNFDKIREVTRKIGCLRHFHKDPQNFTNENVELLYWALDTKNFTLKSHNPSKFAEIIEKTGQILPTPVPNHIIEVIYSENADARFQAIRDGRDVTYAYHGSRLDNFHSILHNGLHHHLNKNSLFGNGTYLSSELSVCFPYSPTGEGCPFNSILGKFISCIAVCEIIDHPDAKCQTKVSKPDVRKMWSWMSVSFSPEIPEKYYIVQNDELLRVRYLLVYTEKAKDNSTRSSVKSWISRNRSIVLMFVYVGILIVVGILNSKTFSQFYRKYLSWQ